MKYTNKRFPPSQRPTKPVKVESKPISLAEAKAALAAARLGRPITAPAATAQLTTTPDDPAVVKAARVFRSAHAAMQVCKRRVVHAWTEDDKKRQGRLRDVLKPTRPLLGYEDPWVSVHCVTIFSKWLEQEENTSMRIAASDLMELHALVAAKPAEFRNRVLSAGWDAACAFPEACIAPGNWTGDMEFLGMPDNPLDISAIGPLKLAVPAKLLEEATSDESFLVAIVGHLNRQLCTISGFKRQKTVDKKVGAAGTSEPSTAKTIGTTGPGTVRKSAGASGLSTAGVSPAKVANTATSIATLEKILMDVDLEQPDEGTYKLHCLKK